MNIAYNADCMEIMAQYPDGYFDLAVVDPPYGDAGNDFKRSDKSRFGGRFDKYKAGIVDACGGGYSVARTGGTWARKYGKKIISWDHAPGEEYFKELFRVSKQQIIWGGNYFDLPPNRCFICWYKTNIPENFTMAMVEYAWCSFNDNAKLVKCSSAGKGDRYHPTQKPVALYDWIFKRYAKPGYKILDTHLGSGSSRIAAYDARLDFVGCEIDKEYYTKSCARYEAHTAQTSLFDTTPADTTPEACQMGFDGCMGE